MLLIGRAHGILAGLATRIDPEFDPWLQTLPRARRFAHEELAGDCEGLGREVFMPARHLWRIPGELDQVLTRARQGALTIQVSLSPETRRAIRRIDQPVKRFAWMVLTVGRLVAGSTCTSPTRTRPLGLVLVGPAVATLPWGLRGG